MDFGDLISLDYEQPQEDFSQYTFSMPESGWSFGQNLGSADFPMPDFSAAYQDFSPEFTQSAYLPQTTSPVQDFNFEVPEVSGADVLRSRGTPDYSSTPGVSNMQSPAQSIASIGQNTAGGAPGRQEDDWTKMLLKSGMGIGASALSTGLSALLNTAMTPSPKSPSGASPAASPAAAPANSPLLSQLAGNAYQMPAFTPLPGAKWSPGISGGPTSVKLSPGLVTADRMKKGGSTGGFSMY